MVLFAFCGLLEGILGKKVSITEMELPDIELAIF